MTALTAAGRDDPNDGQEIHQRSMAGRIFRSVPSQQRLIATVTQLNDLPSNPSGKQHPKRWPVV